MEKTTNSLNQINPIDVVEEELMETLQKDSSYKTKTRPAYETTHIKGLTCQLRELIATKLGLFTKICIDNNRPQPMLDIIKIIKENLK